MRAKVVLPSLLSSLSSLERFIGSILFLEKAEKNRCLLICTEIFENITAHGTGGKNVPVSIQLKKKHAIVKIRFSYPSVAGTLFPRDDHSAIPYYSEVDGRYRGLGLRMCRNLAKTIEYRKGLFKRKITIIL